MTASEYQQLVEFLGQRFAEIDLRFVEVDRRFGEIDHRLVTIEERSEQQFREILGHFDQLYRPLARL